LESEDPAVGTYFVRLLDLSSKLIESNRLIAKACRKHVRNYHKPLRGDQQEAFREMSATVSQLLTEISAALSESDQEEDPGRQAALLEELTARLYVFIDGQVKRIQKGDGGLRSSMFFLSIVLETRRLAETAVRLSYLVDHKHVEPHYSADALLR
jgi:hypothetical protein